MSDDIKKQMWEAMASHPNVMVSLKHQDDPAIPMRAQLDKDADSEFWFYTSKGNRLEDGGQAEVQFVSNGHDLFASIRGTLKKETREEIIDKYWNKSVSAWYDEGRDDPNLLMLRFSLSDAEIWEADPGVKGVYKLLTGKTIDPDEMGKHDKVSL
ncbi:pyridoxamine 5'-phosphate oxidase family protein [Alteromonas halophila]|uniref:General stress protein n=1 Tax=Alteromonas halophila TaxID=516698 RepID=A0A918JFL2_9ALTE|nr:pyridoxamine 5'-phosphate oxidase family protein [Alteromonas halophila]GGW75346.1 general stress protein [Alteromonas halophila]